MEQKKRRTKEELEAMAREALGRAANGTSIANYATIFGEFSERGIPDNEIKPRENILTYWAWKALGRQVKKGEHGVKICVWVPMQRQDSEGKASTELTPTTAVVFHITQTDQAQERKAS